MQVSADGPEMDAEEKPQQPKKLRRRFLVVFNLPGFFFGTATFHDNPSPQPRIGEESTALAMCARLEDAIRKGEARRVVVVLSTEVCLRTLGPRRPFVRFSPSPCLGCLALPVIIMSATLAWMHDDEGSFCPVTMFISFSFRSGLFPRGKDDKAQQGRKRSAVVLRLTSAACVSTG
ncbi:hypothetical protein BKA80DRAFT_254437 [Phyllosticta citrichinensis]